MFRVQRFTEWPWPLHWNAFPLEFLIRPLHSLNGCPLSVKRRFSSLMLAWSHPLPQNLLLRVSAEVRAILVHAASKRDPEFEGSGLLSCLWWGQARGKPATNASGKAISSSLGAPKRDLAAFIGRIGNWYFWGRLDYSCNSTTIKSVSAHLGEITL